MNDFNLFVTTKLALLNDDLAFCHTELFAEKLHQMAIGLAIYWRGGNGDFNFVAM